MMSRDASESGQVILMLLHDDRNSLQLPIFLTIVYSTGIYINKSSSLKTRHDSVFSVQSLLRIKKSLFLHFFLNIFDHIFFLTILRNYIFLSTGNLLKNN